MVLSLGTAIVGIIQLVIAIILAVVALYIGFSVLGKITKGIDEEKEIAKGNAAVGILVASVFIAIGIVVQSGVAGVSKGLSTALEAKELLSLEGIMPIVLSFAQLVLGIVLAIAAIYLALNILDKLTKGIDEFEELKKGNVAVALEMAGVIITTAIIIQSGVMGISSALI
ncbi:MAG: DUF350 domain-containing protein [Candidatus Methanoperedens sp.]|nr:DUF350 domain-containing protein [Candidatus Methanoperedens sp.]